MDGLLTALSKWLRGICLCYPIPLNLRYDETEDSEYIQKLPRMILTRSKNSQVTMCLIRWIMLPVRCVEYGCLKSMD